LVVVVVAVVVVVVVVVAVVVAEVVGVKSACVCIIRKDNATLSSISF